MQIFTFINAFLPIYKVVSVTEKDVLECGEPTLVLDRNLCQAFLPDKPEAVEARLLSWQGGRLGRAQMCLAVSYGRKLKWEENHFDVKAVPLIIPEIQGKERLRPTANGWCMCCYSYFCYVSCVHAGWGSFITGESFSALFSSLYHCDSAITLNVETFFLYSLSCSSSAEDSDKFFLKEPGIWKVILKIQT